MVVLTHQLIIIIKMLLLKMVHVHIRLSTVEFTVDMNGINQPSSNYDNVVVNGSWNGWNGWEYLILYDEDGDGVYNGSLEIDPELVLSMLYGM